MDSELLERFADVTPVEQDDGPDPAVPIAYPNRFKQVMGLFRAMLASNECSERALQLTKSVISCNAANYTAWHFRRKCLVALTSNLRDELQYVSEIAEESPKNYQIWHHRRAVVEMLGDGSAEMAFTASIFAEDAKNYHCWAHRQWVLQRFSLWDGELAYCEELLERDLRNNSAWNQRWFVVSRTEELTSRVLERELLFALRFIERAPNNDSPYNYIRGWVRGNARYADFPFVKERAEKLRRSDVMKIADAPPLLGLLVDIYEEEGNTSVACALCDELAGGIDRVRAKYWTRRKEAAMVGEQERGIEIAQRLARKKVNAMP